MANDNDVANGISTNSNTSAESNVLGKDVAQNKSAKDPARMSKFQLNMLRKNSVRDVKKLREMMNKDMSKEVEPQKPRPAAAVTASSDIEDISECVFDPLTERRIYYPHQHLDIYSHLQHMENPRIENIDDI